MAEERYNFGGDRYLDVTPPDGVSLREELEKYREIGGRMVTNDLRAFLTAKIMGIPVKFKPFSNKPIRQA